MDRRTFLRGTAVAVAGTAAIAATPAEAMRKPGGRRVSIVKGDPGERLYGEACGDGKAVRVYLNGIEQKWAETADEAEGFVDRVVSTPEGNMAVNMSRGEVLIERVYGDVHFVIEPAGQPRLHHDPSGETYVVWPKT